MADADAPYSPDGTYVHRVRVRYGETDQMGRAHHGSFVHYIEEARTRMMAEFGAPYGELERRGFGLVVRSLALRYREAAHFDEELAIRTWVGALRGASVRIDYSIARASNGAVVADGSTHLACVDLRRDPATVAPLPADVAVVLERIPRPTD